MKVLVVYESVYGNTREIAEAIADGLSHSAEVSVEPVSAKKAQPADVDLLVVGGPTHMHGLSTAGSRKMAVEGAKEEDTHIEPDAAAEFGLRGWLSELEERKGAQAASFDTRLDRAAALTGSAARGIARRLHRRGYEVVARESFLVEDSEGPLENGELERARTWGAGLATRIAAAAS